jgi:hypothetical protein
MGSSSEVKQKNTKASNKKNTNTKKSTPNKKNTTKSKNKSKKQGGKQEVMEEDNENNIEEDFENLLLPGQKFPTPPQGDASRAFYESLLEQRPNSLMALRWCIDYGCLEHERVYLILNKFL